MKKIAIVATLALMAPVVASAQTNVGLDPAKINLGFMNVFELPSNGGGFVFGSGWGPEDLTAVYSGSDLTLGPNTIGDPDPFWYIGGGGPGAAGNKIMEANMYAQEDGPLAGQTVVFSASVLSNTLTSAHTVKAFIKDFAPDFSSFVESAVDLTGTGDFSVSLATINDPARHVQYGFQMIGVNVWVTDVGPYGSMTIGAGPVSIEDSSFGNIKSLYR
jgi:hypothetical protein